MASNGWDILVGRTNTDNDELTFKIARKDDYWFHAWQAAGSHVVLRLPNKEAIPDKMILLEAASLAAHFSKARTSTKVPIACTQVKYVRKSKNFPPGKVLVEKEKQLMVKPANPDDFLIKNDSEE
jgi:predicted ribosome quality control (RQC) complex YloA/Tae2 family protein